MKKFLFLSLILYLVYFLWFQKKDIEFRKFMATDFPGKEKYGHYNNCSCTKTQDNTVLDGYFRESRCSCDWKKYRDLINYKFPNGAKISKAFADLDGIGMDIRGVWPCEELSNNCVYQIKFSRTVWWTEYGVLFHVNYENKIVDRATLRGYVGL